MIFWADKKEKIIPRFKTESVVCIWNWGIQKFKFERGEKMKTTQKYRKRTVLDWFFTLIPNLPLKLFLHLPFPFNWPSTLQKLSYLNRIMLHIKLEWQSELLWAYIFYSIWTHTTMFGLCLSWSFFSIFNLILIQIDIRIHIWTLSN